MSNRLYCYYVLVTDDCHNLEIDSFPVILTYKVDSTSDSYKVYSGVYRTTDVCAGLTTFTAPEQVPREMRAFIAELSSETLAAEQVGHIDP
ncbi:hypothetical protein KCU93_g2721, partial [Aureobasidium melanogenum]